MIRVFKVFAIGIHTVLNDVDEFRGNKILDLLLCNIKVYVVKELPEAVQSWEVQIAG